MATTRFHALLRERVEEEIGKVTSDLALGNVKDHAEYKFSAGHIYGLRVSLKLCEELEREADERSDPTSRG